MGTEVSTPIAAAPGSDEPKSFTKILRDANKNEMHFIATKGAKNGKVSTYVVHRLVEVATEGEKAGKLVTKSTTRGASKEFANLDEARIHLQRGIELAIKNGWIAGSPVGSGGGRKVARADAFDLSSLPAPTGTPAPAAKAVKK